MALRIPRRDEPARLTIGDAFAYLLQQTIRPEANISLAAAVQFAAAHIFMRGSLTAAQAQTSLPTLDFLDTDPIEIARAIQNGISSSELSVEGLPESLAEEWIRSPVILDWISGMVCFDIAGRETWIYPTLDRGELEAFFELGDAGGPGPDVSKQVVAVSEVALTTYVRTLMASERLTEADALSRTRDHFSPNVVRDVRWRAAWKDEPNKLRPGERPKPKSGAKSSE